MDWSNETYVRVYTRETDDDLLLSWEALALWRAMLLKFDRSGLIPTKRGPLGLSALVRIPLEVVDRVLRELVEDGRIRVMQDGYFAPNFMAAQEAKKSDRLRQKESRERRARDAADISVTNRDETSHGVTDGHAPSQPVTLCFADPDPLHACASPARAIPQYDAENPEHRGKLASNCWNELRDRQQAVARELGLTAPLPLVVITPGSEPVGFRDLRDRIREEGPDAPKVWRHVLKALTAESVKTRSVEWLSDKSLTEKAWRRARGLVPKWRAGTSDGNGVAKRKQVFNLGDDVKVEVES